MSETITAAQIKKYQKYTTPQLRKKVGEKFRKWIRERDKDQPCISCGKYTTLQAGHFYSAGHYPVLEFHPDNVHGQCLRCNYHLHGNLINYRANLINRIGLERVEKLDLIASESVRKGFKHDRFALIEITNKFK